MTACNNRKVLINFHQLCINRKYSLDGNITELGTQDNFRDKAFYGQKWLLQLRFDAEGLHYFSFFFSKSHKA